MVNKKLFWDYTIISLPFAKSSWIFSELVCKLKQIFFSKC